MQRSECSFHCTGKTENNVTENLGKLRGKVEEKSERLGTVTNSEIMKRKSKGMFVSQQLPRALNIYQQLYTGPHEHLDYVCLTRKVIELFAYMRHSKTIKESLFKNLSHKTEVYKRDSLGFCQELTKLLNTLRYFLLLNIKNELEILSQCSYLQSTHNQALSVS